MISLSPSGFTWCDLAGDQRWTDSHLAAALRGTAASVRFGASSVIVYSHRSPLPLFVALGISDLFPSFTGTLFVWFDIYTCQSLYVSVIPSLLRDSTLRTIVLSRSLTHLDHSTSLSTHLPLSLCACLSFFPSILLLSLSFLALFLFLPR